VTVAYFKGDIPAFAWRNREKPWNILVNITGLQATNQTQDFMNIKQEY